jgi:hypothetical protein
MWLGGLWCVCKYTRARAQTHPYIYFIHIYVTLVRAITIPFIRERESFVYSFINTLLLSHHQVTISLLLSHHQVTTSLLLSHHQVTTSLLLSHHQVTISLINTSAMIPVRTATTFIVTFTTVIVTTSVWLVASSHIINPRHIHQQWYQWEQRPPSHIINTLPYFSHVINTLHIYPQGYVIKS